MLLHLSTFQRVIAILGLLVTTGVLHVSLCRWRFGSMGSDVAIVGAPSPVVIAISPTSYAHSTLANSGNMIAWPTGAGSVFHSPAQPQYGLFSRIDVLLGVGFGVVVPIALLTASAMATCSLRRTRRSERGLCLQCGYDLQFDYTERCSECGWSER